MVLIYYINLNLPDITLHTLCMWFRASREFGIMNKIPSSHNGGSF
jgi:hypothetical protein